MAHEPSITIIEHGPYEERNHVFDGAELELHDDKRCAFARLCHRRDGSDAFDGAVGVHDESFKDRPEL